MNTTLSDVKTTKFWHKVNECKSD